MHSIRWKLILSSLVVVFLPLYYLNHKRIESFDRFTRTALEEEMISQAFMLGEQYKSTVLTAGPNETDARALQFAEIMHRYSEHGQSRLQVLSENGVVLFDSDPHSLVGANFSGRAEIQNTMTGVYDAAWHLSKDQRRVYYYVPVAIRMDGLIVGIAYVTNHTGQITKAILAMKKEQTLAMIVALGAALAVAVVLSSRLTSRLRRLRTATREYAHVGVPLELSTKGKDEIAELGRAVIHMAGDMERRNRYNREFISTVIHEIKMPVTAIKGAAELLEQGAVEKLEARTKFLSNIRYEADRIARMTWELTELSKLDIDMLGGQREQADYCGCVRGIIERLVSVSEQAHARVTTDIPDQDIMTMIIPDRIEQVFSNLLDNAFRYTPVDGQIEIKVALGDDGVVVTSVQDNGPGLSAPDIEKVFDRFYTTEPKNVPKDYGSGLGLAIAKSIIENHQGRIWVASREGEGARFCFTLPVAD